MTVLKPEVLRELNYIMHVLAVPCTPGNRLEVRFYHGFCPNGEEYGTHINHLDQHSTLRKEPVYFPVSGWEWTGLLSNPGPANAKHGVRL